MRCSARLLSRRTPSAGGEIDMPQFDALFPPGVVVEVARAGDDALSHLYPDELALTAGMAPARMREFAAGRTVARRALANLGVAAAPLLPAPGDRHPVWPGGIIGSISHTRDLCVVAVARRGLIVDGRGVASLGIDVEGAGSLDDAVVREICRADELAHLRSMSAPPSGWPKLLFAMKEAAYKAWYPETGVSLAFEEMRINVTADRHFIAEVTSGKAATPGMTIPGRFAWSDEHVAAGALLLLG